MLSLEDCIAMCGLTEEEVLAIGHHENLPEIAAAELGNYLLRSSESAVMPEIIGGRASDEIVKQARKLGSDLIVLGTHGRRGVERLALGSDAEQVVRRSKVPVLLVRGG